MLPYFIVANLAVAVFYVYYRWVLYKGHRFRWNRGYLPGTTAIALLLPFSEA